MKKGDLVSYEGDQYSIIWIGTTKFKKYMAKIRMHNGNMEKWVHAADLSPIDNLNYKSIKLSGFTPVPCEECLDLCYPGSICVVDGHKHV